MIKQKVLNLFGDAIRQGDVEVENAKGVTQKVSATVLGRKREGEKGDAAL